MTWPSLVVDHHRRWKHGSSDQYCVLCSEPLIVYWRNCKEKNLRYGYLCLSARLGNAEGKEWKSMGEAPCLPTRVFIIIFFPAAVQSDWFSQQREDKLASLAALIVSKQKVKWANAGVKCKWVFIRCVFVWNRDGTEEFLLEQQRGRHAIKTN